MLNDRIANEAQHVRCVYKLARIFNVSQARVAAALRARGFTVSRNGYAKPR